MRKIRKTLPTLKRYNWEGIDGVLYFPPISEKLKGEVHMTFADQIMSTARKGVEGGTNRRSAIYEMAKHGLDFVLGLDEVHRKEIDNNIVNTPAIDVKATKTKLVVEKDFDKKITEYQNSLILQAKKLGLNQHYLKNSCVFSKMNVFVHLVELGLNLYK